ncbi:hypothetical protein [Burkholderia orbicola]|uniref:hypothetical protein n=1 Tax=Burkholderia orbicola TaxID=2978683 RepID=UPI002FE2A160
MRVVVKRIKRNPEKFEVIDLYTALGRDRNYKLSVEEDVNAFMARIRASLQVSFDSPILLHGKRVEAMFAHVAGALGRCRLIKQEDSGDFYSDDADIQAPDYSLVTKDGRRLFVEVKNCNHNNIRSPFTISREYFAKLESYSAMQGADLKVAIFFSRFQTWVLLSKESFQEQRKRYAITFPNALARNEMSSLGDRMIGTTPSLEVQLLADPNKEAAINDEGVARFIIGSLRFFCGGRELLSDMDRQIAFYLMRYGKWYESAAEAILDEEKLLGVRFEYEPEAPSEGQDFQMIGTLSTMVSTAYCERTTHQESVVALDVNVDPEVFSLVIPEGYKSEDLPLWQFIIEPNPDFIPKLSAPN